MIELGAGYDDAMRSFWGTELEDPAPPHTPRDVTARWIEHESGVPWLRLLLDFPYEESRREIVPLLDRFVEHRGADGRGWRCLTLHGLGSEQTRSPRHYGFTEDSAPYGWTEIAERCPATTTFFRDRYPMARLLRIRFMLLEPRGYIAPHTDTPVRYLSAMNLAITNPAGAYFKMAGAGYVPFEAGRAFLVDVGREHSVVNLSTEPRIHMIAHAEQPRAAWDDLVVCSYRARQEAA